MRSLTFPAIVPALVAAALFAPGGADAATFRTEYNATLIGLPVGTMKINLDVEESSYAIRGSTRVRGVVRLFSDGEGNARAEGGRPGGGIAPAAFSYRYEEKDDVDTLDMGFSGGRVTAIAPKPKPPGKKRVPLADEDLVGALDPLSALLVPVEASAPEAACDRSLPIFDGKTRYDLVLSYARREAVADVKGYAGAATVCSVRFVPVSGHRRDGDDIVEWQNASPELWLAPLGETGTMFPVRLRASTSWGPLVIRASRFEAE